MGTELEEVKKLGKNIEELRNEKQETEEVVLEFLKEHEGQGFTGQELANRLGVDRRHIRSQLPPSNPFKKWRIDEERDGLETYYHAERINKWARPIIVTFLGVVAGLIIGAILL